MCRGKGIDGIQLVFSSFKIPQSKKEYEMLLTSNKNMSLTTLLTSRQWLSVIDEATSLTVIIVYVNKNNKVCSVLPASLDSPFLIAPFGNL